MVTGNCRTTAPAVSTMWPVWSPGDKLSAKEFTTETVSCVPVEVLAVPDPGETLNHVSPLAGAAVKAVPS